MTSTVSAVQGFMRVLGRKRHCRSAPIGPAGRCPTQQLRVAFSSGCPMHRSGHGVVLEGRWPVTAYLNALWFCVAPCMLNEAWEGLYAVTTKPTNARNIQLCVNRPKAACPQVGLWAWQCLQACAARVLGGAATPVGLWQNHRVGLTVVSLDWFSGTKPKKHSAEHFRGSCGLFDHADRATATLGPLSGRVPCLYPFWDWVAECRGKREPTRSLLEFVWPCHSFSASIPQTRVLF